MVETIRRKNLKKKARKYLKSLGHKDIREEYRLVSKLNLTKSDQYTFFVDIAALDGQKVAIVVGNSHPSVLRNKEKECNKQGFHFIHWPYSTVKRLRQETMADLELLHPDLNKAIEKLIKFYKENKHITKPQKDILKYLEETKGKWTWKRLYKEFLQGNFKWGTE